MNWKEKAKSLEGFATIRSMEKSLDISRATAVNYMHGLRKGGFITETLRGRRGIRLYHITPLRLRKIGNPGLYDIINANSSLKIAKPLEHRVYGREMSLEEAFVEALRSRDFRLILSSLELFRKIHDWKLLYALAKKHGLQRAAGALYCLSRKHFRVRRIDRRIELRMRKSRPGSRYIIPGARSRDFGELEREWGVFIPFNKSDMERLRG